jgi:predicted nucleotidyltransferase
VIFHSHSTRRSIGNAAKRYQALAEKLEVARRRSPGTTDVTDTIIAQLVAGYPFITEVWRFGSRENGTARDDSDWDYLVWTDNPALLNILHQDARFNQEGIDLLVVDGPFAVKPWPDPDGRWKKLRLDEDLRWRAVSQTEATYVGTKKRNPHNPRDIAVDLKPGVARLVYRRP